jgi:hypothetical protein
MKRRISAIAVGLLFATARFALAGQYTDPAGFSFTYPEGWTPLSKHSQASIPQEVKIGLAKNHIDLSKVNVALLHPTTGDFYENLNVIVTPGSAPIDEAGCRELRSVIPQQMRLLGVTIDDVQAEVQQIGENKAIIIEFESRMPGVSFPLHQCQFYMSAGGKMFIVTCTAKAADFSQFAPTFAQIAGSFKLAAGRK